MFKMKIPNKLTKETLEKMDRGEDLYEVDSVEGLIGEDIMITKTTTKFFPCECGTEGLTAVRPECSFGSCGDPRINIAFWGFGHGDQRWSWRLRWRCIWNILVVGKPYDDMVCMRVEVAKKFASHILSLVNKKI